MVKLTLRLVDLRLGLQVLRVLGDGDVGIAVQPGELRLTVSPSETRGQWDLGLRTLEGIVLSSWVEAAEALPKFVERTLRDYLTARRTDAYRAMHWVLLIGLAALAASGVTGRG